jgi:hypothetical protein
MQIRLTKAHIRAYSGGLAFILLIACLVVALYYFPVTYGDWWAYFRPAALSLANPYQVRGVLNPPWTFVLLHPLAVLPGRWGGVGIAFLSIVAVALLLRSPAKLVAVSASAPFIFVMVLGQLDALVLYGLMLPSSLGPLLILAKPQGAVLTVLTRINRRSLLVLGVVLVISMLVWGFWPAQMLRSGLVPDELRNASFFPFSLPLVPVLLYFGIKRRSDAFLCWATLCASPFFQMHSVLPAIACTIRETNDWRIWALLPILSWLVYAWHVGWVI